MKKLLPQFVAAVALVFVGSRQRPPVMMMSVLYVRWFVAHLVHVTPSRTKIIYTQFKIMGQTVLKETLLVLHREFTRI